MRALGAGRGWRTPLRSEPARGPASDRRLSAGKAWGVEARASVERSSGRAVERSGPGLGVSLNPQAPNRVIWWALQPGFESGSQPAIPGVSIESNGGAWPSIASPCLWELDKG